MSFQPADGNWTSVYLKTKTAVQYNPGSLLTNDGTDNIPATSSSANLVGIIDELKASTDTSTDKIKVLVPRDFSAELYGDVGTGTLTAAMEGRKVDLKDEDEVDVNASTTDVLTVKGFISAARGRFAFNPAKL